MKLLKYLEKKNKTHLIFDFDYTLFKMVIPWEKWHEKIEKRLEILDRQIINDYKKGEINLSTLQNLYVSRYGERVNKRIIEHNTWFETNFAEKFIPNKKLIAQLPELSNYKNFIWSSNTKPNVPRVLRENKLFKYFEKVVTRNDVSLVKPYSDGFSLIHKGNTPMNLYLFIGDSGSDKKAAKNLEMDYFRINHFKDDTTSS